MNDLAGPGARVFTALLFGLVGLSWWGLALALLHRFTAGWLALGTVAGAVLGVGWLRRGGRPITPRGIGAFLPAVVLAAPLYLFPHEYLSGWDPGIYLNVGAMLANRGGLVYHDPLWASLEPEARATFAERPGTRFDGFRPDSAPNFLPLYPVWVALGVLLGGPEAGLWINPAFGLLAAVLLFHVTRVASGSAVVAWMAGLLLLLNVNHIYFARFSTSEMLALVLGLTAVTATIEGLETGGRAWLVVGGLAFPLVALTKIDALAPLALVAGALVVAGCFPTGRPVATVLGIPFFAGLGLVLGHYAVFAPTYIDRLYRTMRLRTWVVPTLFAATAAAWALATFALGPTSDRPATHRLRAILAKPPPTPRATVVTAAVGLVSLVGLYAFRVRAQAHAWDRWIIVLWVFTPLGVALAIAGAARWARARPSVLRVAIAAAVPLVAVATLVDPTWGREPLHFWISRRLEPVVVPIVSFFAAVALARVWARPRHGRWLALALLAVVLGAPLGSATAWLFRRDDGGLLDYSRFLAGRFSPGDIVISHRGWLVSPLHFFWGVESFALHPDRDGAAALRQVDRWRRNGRRVFYVSTGSPVYTPTHEFTVRAVDRVQLRRLERLVARWPRRLEERDLTVRIHEILPWREETVAAAARQPAPTGLWIDTGRTVFGLEGGFGAPQYVTLVDRERGGFRWTRSRATIHTPPVPGEARQVVVRMWHARPAALGDPAVRVTINGEAGGTAVVRGGPLPDGQFPAYTFAFTPRAGKSLRITLEAEHWIPGATGGPPDDRELGVMVGGIGIPGAGGWDRAIADPALRLEGFHDLEGGTPRQTLARWLVGRGVVHVPTPPPGQGPYRGVVAVASGRRDGSPPVLVRLSLDGAGLGEWRVGGGFQKLVVPLAPGPRGVPVGRLEIEAVEEAPDSRVGDPVRLLVDGVGVDPAR